MKRIISVLMTIIVLISSPVHIYANEQSDPKSISPVNSRVKEFIQSDGDDLLLLSKNYGYMTFVNNLKEDALSQYLIEITDKLIHTGSKPDKEKYIETLINIIVTYDMDRSSDVANQRSMDNLKTINDYAVDIEEMGINAATVMVGNNFNASQLQDDILTAIDGLKVLQDSLLNWVEALSNLETIIQDYSEHDEFLKVIEDNSDGDLKEAAQNLREAMKSAVEIRLDTYKDINMDNFKNYTEFFFSDVFIEAAQHTGLYKDNNVFRKLIDTSDNVVRVVSTWNSAWDLGKAIGTMVGDAVVGGENLIKRILELMALSDITEILQSSIRGKGSEYMSSLESNKESGLAEEYVSLSNYLVGSRIRGEYIIYSIVAKDSGLLSWFGKESAKEARDWYDSKTDKIIGLQNDLLYGEGVVYISGRVVDKNGKSALGLHITLSNKENGNTVYEGITDENGFFEGKAIEGECIIEIGSGNYWLMSSTLSAPLKRGKNDLGTFTLRSYEENIFIVGVDGPSDEDIKAKLNEFISQVDIMYGKTCTFTCKRNTNNGNYSYDKWWDNISPGVVLGYSIEDFDDDDRSELLTVTLVDDYCLQLEMYEVVNGEVELADTKYLDTGTSYGAVSLPCGRADYQEICGLLSAFIVDSNHRIFIQSSDYGGLLADGNETFIASVIYRNNLFSDYGISHEIGSSVEGSIPDRVQDLLNMGVPNVDYDTYDRIFYGRAKVIGCFSGGVHEIVNGEQYTIEVRKENAITSKIVTETVFATQDGRIEKPTDSYGPDADELSLVYETYNDFFAEGYRTVTAYRPDEWALIDLNDDGIPEILFKENSTSREGTFEIYYYNGQTGTVEEAGSFYSEYYEVVRYCADKHLLSIDGSMAGFRNWSGYTYDNNSIDWSFTLSATTDPGSSPRMYILEVTDENGHQNLGKYEYDGRDKIWDDYFGEQTEVEFALFPTGCAWNLPYGALMHLE